MKRYLSICLITALLALALAGAGCGHKKAVTDPNAVTVANPAPSALDHISGEAERAGVYADIGVAAVDQLKASSFYADAVAQIPQLEQVAKDARAALVILSQSAKPFAELVKTFSTLDPADKQQLSAAFEPMRKAIADLKQPVQELVRLIVQYLNSKHLTSIDLDKLQQRISFGFTVIDGAARLIPTWIN